MTPRRRRLFQVLVWTVPLAGVGAGAAWPSRVMFDVSILLLAALVAIGAASMAVTRWRDRLHALGRPGGSAAMLVGLGAALATWGVAQGLGRLSYGGNGGPHLAAAAFALGALGLGVLVLAGGSDAARALLTIGSGLAAAAAWQLPGPMETASVGALAATSLLLTWNPAPPTTPDGPDEPGTEEPSSRS